MNDTVLLTIDGHVDQPLQLTLADLQTFAGDERIDDVSQIVPNRSGVAVKLAALLARAEPRDGAAYLGLHASLDDFHASIPLAPVVDSALLVFEQNGQVLDTKGGGPTRLLIPDSAACQTDEIDECANVKFLDRIELTVEKGFDNRPTDDEQHEKLHQQQQGTAHQ